MSDDEYIPPSDHSGDEAPGPSMVAARIRPLPRTTFRSVEYPGPMQRADQIMRHINQEDIDDTFNAPMSDMRQLELRYRPENRAAVPVRGNRVASQKVLVKITKRRRKGKVDQGVFTADVMGNIPQTVRFRSMADYQYTPAADSSVQELCQALVDLDYDYILDYKVPSLHEEYYEPNPLNPDGTPPAVPYRSLMELQPTPLASARQLPHNFNYRMSANTVEEEIWDDDAQETKKRYVNRSRAQGWSVPAVGHGHPVPTEPEQSVRERMDRLDKRIMTRLRELFEARPIWLRYALLTNFDEKDRYEILTNKLYLPAVAFTYGAGPYWKTLVRYGYDATTKPEAHKYQRVYVYLDVKRGRNTILNSAVDPEDEDESKRPSFWWEHEQDARIAQGLRPPLDNAKIHIFDGQVLHRNKPDYQLIDITDPFIAKYIYDPTCMMDVCDHHTGWYRPVSFELIKALLRSRFADLRDTHEPPTDDSCNFILESYDRAIEESSAAGTGDKEAAEAFMRRVVAHRRLPREERP
ncbi:hypothetical protein CC85DRAFT_284365 [Cutaneotrichosporon oleaginosum]|uniref:Transcription factor IIIC subunit 5 HTH domain-containing protein n=1 Tax=Cutaneotrichosporon oleaginosum TaxID=879819 RepID=A0A0J0XR91_9TREE|nr:uncharacterized protein CC85DRAFT_284365 [Cutaneotrichosporon oleaginosum]KLT43651.1 hypothetical protein CC85DRAFT_284365 [Cutaneotrichosporon oleaginosum]TXT12683.1 hypothetical protein COLE_03093 [Cutaneotrichosporon oleaginosum]